MRTPPTAQVERCRIGVDSLNILRLSERHDNERSGSLLWYGTTNAVNAFKAVFYFNTAMVLY